MRAQLGGFSGSAARPTPAETLRKCLNRVEEVDGEHLGAHARYALESPDGQTAETWLPSAVTRVNRGTDKG